MSEIDSGGFVFPVTEDAAMFPGLTKREWFAGMSLQAVYTHYMGYSDKHGMDENWRDGIAGDAFKMADAMIRAGKGEK